MWLSVKLSRKAGKIFMKVTVFSRLKNYIEDSYREMKKVTWPTKEETAKLSIAVILISLAVAAFLGALDFIFHWLIENYIL